MVEAESRGRMAETREKCVTSSHGAVETEARALAPWPTWMGATEGTIPRADP